MDTLDAENVNRGSIDWRVDVTDDITGSCIDCIKMVEKTRSFEPAENGQCIDRSLLILEDEDKRTTCGVFSLSKYHYNTCSQVPPIEGGGPNENITQYGGWKACAFDRKCSRLCISYYLNHDRRDDCGRGGIEDRTCIDYGIIYTYGHDACNKRDTRSEVALYAQWMKDKCGVYEKAARPSVTSERPTTTKSAAYYASIIAPVVVISAMLVLAVAGIFYLKRRKARRNNNAQVEHAEVNAYHSEAYDSGVNLSSPNNYSLRDCEGDIQTMMKKHLISVSRFEVYEEIGRGQFGVIRRAKLSLNQESRDNTEVAIKLIKNQTPEDIKCFLREAYIMSQFDHVNVLNLTGIIWEHNEPPAVVTPYMGKGSLLDLVRKSDMKFSESELINFMSQLAHGLEYLELQKFVHRDIALRNCLVSNLFVVKISDFGLTRDIYDSRIYECTDMSEKRLPWKWLAPECIRQGSFTHKSDVWSFGVTIWELFTNGSSPYPAIGNLSVLQECLQAGYRLSKPDKLPQQLYELMGMMWSEEPESRPSFREIGVVIKALLDTLREDTGYSYSMMFAQENKQSEQKAADSEATEDDMSALNISENNDDLDEGQIEQYADKHQLYPDIYY